MTRRAPRAKLRLANLPTPLFRHDALDALVGAPVWVKRDDMTGGVETGNKVRKLEYLLADAQARKASVVITCGGFQSNHCRATAVLARACGMRSVLLLRASDPPPAIPAGNAFLDALVGAEIRVITPAEYADRDALMAHVANELRTQGQTPYVIPEGGSNGLGALGYVDAMAELRDQLDAGEAGAPRAFDMIAFACGSGGTAAGVALGAAQHGVASRAVAFAVCDDAAYFEHKAADLMAEARALSPALATPAPLSIEDAYRGPAYGIPTDDQVAFLIRVARATGLVLDPVYTGKALYGLARIRDKPAALCFIHTGGHPGLLADTARLCQHPDW